MPLGDADDPAKQGSTEQEYEYGAKVDRQEIPAAAGRPSHSAVEGPRRAVHAQREAIDPRLSRGGAGNTRAPVPEVGNCKKDRDVTGRNGKQSPTAKHSPISLSMAIVFRRCRGASKS